MLFSCVREDLDVHDDLGDDTWYEVDFGHNELDHIDITTKASLGIVQESRVLNVYVFLFTKSGKRIYSGYFDKNNRKESAETVKSANENCWYGYTDSNGKTGGTIRIKAPKSSDATICLIANLDEDMMNISPDLLNTITAISDLQALNVSLMQTTTSRNGYFPMVAELRGVNVGTSGITAGKAYLERLDSKVSLNIRLAADETLKSFVPDVCIVRNIPAGSRVMNGSGSCDYEAAGYFDSELLFDRDIVDASGTIIGASSSFYMLENRESAGMKNSVGSYHDRDRRIKYPDGTYDTTDGLWLNAPENSTYLEIHGELEMLTESPEYGTRNLIGDVTYYVHLGDFKSDLNNYDVLRNTHYTYDITVHGVDDISVEVWTNIENQSGATGDLYTAESHFTFDAHYGQMVFSMDAEKLKTETMTFYVKTPFGREGIPERVGGGYNIGDLDYKWIKFLVNKVDPNGQGYLMDNRTYPGDENQMFISQGSSERLMDVVELLDYIKKEKEKYDAYKAAGFEGANPSAFLKDANGRYVICITAFVNEYFYEQHPTENTVISWKDFVNKPNRFLHILTDTKSSLDGASSYSESIVTFRQKSIQTPYNLSKAEVTSAFGCETVDETRDLNLSFYENDANYKGRDLGNNSLSNGIYNTACLWNLFSNGAFKTGSNREKWETYLNYNVPDVTSSQYMNHFLRNDKMCMRYSALARNRDNNGNGYIDPDEVRWYITPLEQLYTLYIGELGMTREAQLYPTAYASLPNEKVNGVWLWRNHIVCSNQTTVTNPNQYGDKYWPDMLWAEEGVSVSGYGQEWSKQSVKSIRCVRNLGMDNPTEASIADKSANIPDPMILARDAGNGVYRFDLSNINEKSVRYYTTHELIPDNENGESSRTCYGFETYPDFTSYSGSYIDLKNSLELGNSPCPDGYRVPNVREGAIMSLFCPSQWWGSHEIISSSYYSLGDLGGQYDKGTTTWTFIYKYVTLSGGINSLRCVKDL